MRPKLSVPSTKPHSQEWLCHSNLSRRIAIAQRYKSRFRFLAVSWECEDEEAVVLHMTNGRNFRRAESEQYFRERGIVPHDEHAGGFARANRLDQIVHLAQWDRHRLHMQFFRERRGRLLRALQFRSEDLLDVGVLKSVCQARGPQAAGVAERRVDVIGNFVRVAHQVNRARLLGVRRGGRHDARKNRNCQARPDGSHGRASYRVLYLAWRGLRNTARMLPPACDREAIWAKGATSVIRRPLRIAFHKRPSAFASACDTGWNPSALHTR